MVEAVLDLLLVHREVILRHAPVVIQDMLGIAPEALDAVDVVPGAPRSTRVRLWLTV